MAFPSSQQPLEDLEHPDAGTDMLWTTPQDFDSDLQLHQGFINPTQQTNKLWFENDQVIPTISPYSIMPSVHMPVSQTGTPFRPRQSQVPDFRPYHTDDRISVPNELEVRSCEIPLKSKEGQRGEVNPSFFPGASLSVHNHFSDAYQFQFQPGRSNYQSFMPASVTTPSTINTHQLQQGKKPSGMSSNSGLKAPTFTQSSNQDVSRKRSRKRPRPHAPSRPLSLGPLSGRPLDVPALSSTTSTLDSTADEIVSNHAASVIESWLHHFPAVHVPTDDDFKALATLTRLRVETVRMWFGQRLRRQSEVMSSSAKSISQPVLPNMKLPASSSLSNPLTLSSTSRDDYIIQPAVLQGAATWVRLRGTKCTVNPDADLLQRYDPRPYQCTLACGKNFDKKADWRKHEEINYPQEGWLCREIACADKSLSDPGKISYQKDKFKQHYSNAHRGISCENRCSDSHFLVESRFPRKCGFCTTYRFSDWQDRITHIGDHFSSDRYDMTRWQIFNDYDDDVDDGGDDDNDGGVDESQSDQNDPFDRDFDWQDHDNDEDAFSDSEDDSDDSPPGSAPKQRVQHISDASQMATMSAHTWNWNSINMPKLNGSVNDTRYGSKLTQFPHNTYRPGFTSIRILGIGPYSVVDEVQDWTTGNTFARKTVHFTTQRTFKALETEVEIMKKLHHPHIVRFVGEYATDHSVSIWMTPSADFDLDYLMATNAKYVDTQTVSQWFSCLASAVHYLHSHSIKHQDIKPSNILIRGDTIFLADFGVAKIFNESDSTTSTSGNMTRKYCSPETAHDGCRGRKSDIFSLGCVFLEMLSFLLQDEETDFLDYQWKHFVGDGIFHENLAPISTWLDLLSEKAANPSTGLHLGAIIQSCKEMMEIDPHNRPSADQLTRHLVPGSCCESDLLSQRPSMEHSLDPYLSLISLQSKDRNSRQSQILKTSKQSLQSTKPTVTIFRERGINPPFYKLSATKSMGHSHRNEAKILVSFLGQTGSGKSTLVKKMIDSQQNPLENSISYRFSAVMRGPEKRCKLQPNENYLQSISSTCSNTMSISEEDSHILDDIKKLDSEVPAIQNDGRSGQQVDIAKMIRNPSEELDLILQPTVKEQECHMNTDPGYDIPPVTPSSWSGYQSGRLVLLLAVKLYDILIQWLVGGVSQLHQFLWISPFPSSLQPATTKEQRMRRLNYLDSQPSYGLTVVSPLIFFLGALIYAVNDTGNSFLGRLVLLGAPIMIFATSVPLRYGSSLGSTHLYFIVLSGMIGVGIFANSTCNELLDSSGPAALLVVFLVVGFLVFTIMQVLAELASASLPLSGLDTTIWKGAVFNNQDPWDTRISHSKSIQTVDFDHQQIKFGKMLDDLRPYTRINFASESSLSKLVCSAQVHWRNPTSTAKHRQLKSRSRGRLLAAFLILPFIKLLAGTSLSLLVETRFKSFSDDLETKNISMPNVCPESLSSGSRSFQDLTTLLAAMCSDMGRGCEGIYRPFHGGDQENPNFEPASSRVGCAYSEPTPGSEDLEGFFIISNGTNEETSEVHRDRCLRSGS